MIIDTIVLVVIVVVTVIFTIFPVTLLPLFGLLIQKTFISVPSTLHKVEMFYLPEILALTDYKHTSSFTGGTFFGKTARSLNDDQAYNRCVLRILN